MKASTLKLSGTMVSVPLTRNTTVTVKKIQLNGFEVTIKFINLQGVIVKQVIAENSEIDGTIQVIAAQYNYHIVD